MNDREKSFVSAVDKTELVELTRDLVRIDSVIRPEKGGTEKDVVRFIADWIRREVGIEPVVEEVVPGRENIILTIDSGKPGPCLMIEGHTDVVSEGDPADWDYEPFGAQLVDGKIYGRGSCDMKAGDAIAMQLAKIFATLDSDFKADIEFIEDRPVVGIEKDEPIAALSAQAYRDITGKEPIWNGVPGTSTAILT